MHNKVQILMVAAAAAAAASSSGKDILRIRRDS